LVSSYSREWTPQVTVSAVNPSTTRGSNPSLTGDGHVEQGSSCEPQYEDIDKYDYIKSRCQEEPYEKMSSVQIIPTETPLQILPSTGVKVVPEYDYAAVQ
jgi:hypothetical protein